MPCSMNVSTRQEPWSNVYNRRRSHPKHEPSRQPFQDDSSQRPPDARMGSIHAISSPVPQNRKSDYPCYGSMSYNARPYGKTCAEGPDSPVSAVRFPYLSLWMSCRQPCWTMLRSRKRPIPHLNPLPRHHISLQAFPRRISWLHQEPSYRKCKAQKTQHPHRPSSVSENPHGHKDYLQKDSAAL